MNNLNLPDLIKSIAPTIATALGGPMAGAAVKMISTAVLGNDKGTEDEIANAIVTGKPNTIDALKSSELAFKAHIKQLEVNLSALNTAAKDRDSARNRQIALKDHTPSILAYFLFSIFLAMIAAIYVKPEIANNNAFDMLLGAITTSIVAVVTYYFGSSAGSKSKTEMLNNGNSNGTKK